MPKNTTPAGVRLPKKVLNSLGKWVNNKFAGIRLGKNSCLADSRPELARKKLTHTSPIVRTPENDGHNNLTRLRHAATKRMHNLTKMDNVVEETSFR